MTIQCRPSTSLILMLQPRMASCDMLLGDTGIRNNGVMCVATDRCHRGLGNVVLGWGRNIMMVGWSSGMEASLWRMGGDGWRDATE